MDLLPLDPAIKLTFNQPMDTEVSNRTFRSAARKALWPGKFSWNEEKTILTFVPDDLLERNVGYTVNVNAAASAQEGWSSVRIMVPCTPPMTTLL